MKSISNFRDGASLNDPIFPFIVNSAMAGNEEEFTELLTDM